MPWHSNDNYQAVDWCHNTQHNVTKNNDTQDINKNMTQLRF